MQETQFNPWIRKILRKRKWQPTPVFSPGKYRGQRSLTDCSSRGHKKSDVTGTTKQWRILKDVVPQTIKYSQLYLKIKYQKVVLRKITFWK